MTASSLLAQLRERGVTLYAKGDRLRFHPRSAVGSDLLDELRQHKSELLRLLSRPKDEQQQAERRQAPDAELPDNLLDELSAWTDPPTEAELQRQGQEILRNHAMAKARMAENGLRNGRGIVLRFPGRPEDFC